MIRFKKKETIVFSGDSITDGGRGRSMDLNHHMGHGYQYILAAKLSRDNLEWQPRFINKGYSGAKVGEIYNTWYKDVIHYNPTMISILIGINDASSGNSNLSEYVAARYERNYDMLLHDTASLLPDTKLVICEPFFIPAKHPQEFVKYSPHVFCERDFEVAEKTEEEIQYIVTQTQKLQKIARGLAKEYGCTFVPLQDVFEKALRHVETEYLLWDGVHPTVAGHALLAERWYECVSKADIF